MKTAFLPILLVFAFVSPVLGEGASLERAFGLDDEFFPHIEAPASILSGSWEMKLDEKVDGKVEGGRTIKLEIRSANSVIVGGESPADKSGGLLVTGKVMRGRVTIVRIQLHGDRNYKAFLNGIQMDSGEIVGTHVDTSGFRGDWSMAFTKTKIIEPVDASLPDTKLYESVLGVYGKAIRGSRHPFINLRPPARNLWTDEIQEHVAKVLPYEKVDYIGAAKLVITKPGKHMINIPGAGVQVKINGELAEAGMVELKRGVYNVEIYTNHWGQPYLTYAEVSVIRHDTKKPVPFVNTIETITSFRNEKLAGKKPIEVCEFELKRYEPPAE